MRKRREKPKTHPHNPRVGHPIWSVWLTPGPPVLSQQINEMRNKIVHEGEFCNEDESKEIIEKAREFIETLVRLYEPKFRLKDQKKKRRPKTKRLR
jgi:hypothetical protein